MGINLSLTAATLALFNAVPLSPEKVNNTSTIELDYKTLSQGFLFSSELKLCYTVTDLLKIYPIVSNSIGRNNAEVNATFFKTWEQVENIDESKRLQIVSSSVKALGKNNTNGLVNIPGQSFGLPKNTSIPIIIINGVSLDNIKNKVFSLVDSGIALNTVQVTHIFTILKNTKITPLELEGIKNKELRSQLFTHLNMVPTSDEEFIRLLMYILTKSPMVIKNKTSIISIKQNIENNTVATQVLNLFNQYDKENGITKLAGSFNRYKPLYLAMRTSKIVRPTINKISKLSKKHHTPLYSPYLMGITHAISHGESIDFNKIDKSLNKLNTFKKVSLYNAFSYRYSDNKTIIYRIRNGKVFAKTITADLSGNKELKKVMDTILESIISDLKSKLDGKTFYIEDDVKFAMPTSGKQFIGGIPAGTILNTEGDLIFGVQWKNGKNVSVDLDLSLNNAFNRIGWNAHFKTASNDILYSGDKTSAPEPYGASELFYVKKDARETVYLVNLNFYNQDGNNYPAPYKLIFSESLPPKNFMGGYAMDASQIKFTIPQTIEENEILLGALLIENTQKTFVIDSLETAKRAIAKHRESSDLILNYICGTVNTRLYLNDLLTKAGATLITNKEKADFNLSLLTISNNTLLNLLTKE